MISTRVSRRLLHQGVAQPVPARARGISVRAPLEAVTVVAIGHELGVIGFGAFLIVVVRMVFRPTSPTVSPFGVLDGSPGRRGAVGVAAGALAPVVVVTIAARAPIYPIAVCQRQQQRLGR